GKGVAGGPRLLAHRFVFHEDHQRAAGRHAHELCFRRPRHARFFPRAPAAGAARLRLRARLRQAPREDAGCPAGRAESARIQMRRAMGHAGCALSCLCGAEAYSARRLRAAGQERRLSDSSAVIPAEARPRLPRGVRLVHNEAQGGWVLLAPERVFKADAIAAEIIRRCTGEVTFGEIVDDLAKSYAAPREKILADVSALLRGLADKRLLEL